MSLTAKKCIPCEGANPLPTEYLAPLMKQVPQWSLSADGKWINRKFAFRNFANALAFVNKVGELAEEEGHHPDIELGWGYANVKLQTHAAGGLHENDFIMAAKIDEIQ